MPNPTFARDLSSAVFFALLGVALGVLTSPFFYIGAVIFAGRAVHLLATSWQAARNADAPERVD